MRYILELRTAWGRQAYCILDTQTNAVIARCDLLLDARFILQALEAYTPATKEA